MKSPIKNPDKQCDTAAMLSDDTDVRMYMFYHLWINGKPNQHEIS